MKTTTSIKKIDDLRQYLILSEELQALTTKKKKLKEKIKEHMGKDNSIKGGCFVATSAVAVRTTLDRKRLLEDQGVDFLEAYIKTHISESFKITYA